VLAQTPIPLADDETDETLFERFPAIAAELLPVVFDRIARGDRGDPQLGGEYPSSFEDDYRFVDVTQTAAEVAPASARVELCATDRSRRGTDPRVRRDESSLGSHELDRGRRRRKARLFRRPGMDRRVRRSLYVPGLVPRLRRAFR
jgi:hypothetical protein